MGAGSSRSVISEGLDEVIARSFVESTSTCSTGISAAQSMDIVCSNIGEGGTTAENSFGCVKCYSDIADEQIDNYNIIQAGWENGKADIPQTYAQEMKSYKEKMDNCRYMCKSCVVEDLGQNIAITWSTTCNIDSTVRTTFENSITNNLTQSLTDNQDILSSLAGVLGPGSNQQVISKVSNLVSTFIDVAFMNRMYTVVNTVQPFSFTNQNVKGQTQTATIAGITSFLAKNDVLSHVITDTQWTQYQELYNSENTIGPLGEIVRKTTLSMGEILGSILGKIIVALISVLLLVLMLMSSVGIYQSIYKNKC